MANLTIQKMYDYSMLSTASYIRAGIKRIHEEGDKCFLFYLSYIKNLYKIQ